MNILVGCTDTINPIIQRFCRSLAEHPDVEAADQDLGAFWRGKSEVDILHLHWPRALFESWRDPTRSELTKLRSRLEKWRSHIPIIVTVHNVRPHYRDENPIFKDLYRLVFQKAHGLVHMGEASKDLLHKKYDLENKKEVVIPHGNYDVFPNTVTQHQARQKLGIGQDVPIALVFGQVRDPEELALILDGTREWGGGQTLIAGRLGWTDGWVVPYVVRAYHRLRTVGQPVRFRFGHFDNEFAQHLLNATDVVLIPRKRVLNSGNVSLGFTFGRVVVGPKMGVVGEVLQETGNPMFDPSSPQSVGTAIERGCELQASGKGEQNANYASKNMSWDTIADQHVQFYQSFGKRHPD